MSDKLTKTLNIFVRTVQTGSMSRAAADLLMTTSAISQQIKQIEQDVGLSLFNRSPRELTLTEAGELYYQSCLQMLAVATATSEQLQHLQNCPSGQLKLAAPVGFGGGLLSEPVKHLISQFSDIDVHLTLSDEPIDMIRTGIDLVLAIGPLEDSNLIARQLASWPLILCVHKNHALAQQPKITLDDLKAHNRIAHIAVDPALTHLTRGVSTTLPKARITINNMQTVIQFVLDELGYAILPEPEVRNFLATGELLEICSDWQLPHYDVFALTPARDTLAAKTKAAIKALNASFSAI
ncbi:MULTISPECIES: LysR family transcriptional regulator [Pseudoalteromonas]|jgi:DNA-binding transcriptional LysR family regulator|uniref:LysR family transcriptional regulator n=1 Tax=Pseudoalteromonas tetraodonis TaxID=43659 RepID=A0ABD4EK72_9GAMM|nr:MULTISPECIES: LysR family transcriptional regulator [Pseudoalteromonas]KYL31559.1 LysR family transcriptional regulator [Pseudoalteromonas spiralis]MDN3405621.1 LysR family transcriptional regulator [Pseudoalteromonas sp. APC 3218]MDN3409288.1 LysR family transcriptional regulator [Pseudoalteromonas sp. APC 3894]MDN3416693.1 LysR family transcriptional regulator [Pseudoalteromonas sp. APC 3227]MDN3420390.1 LysR family transcriptional regulator [Pseudoalteromonas sp. APC 3895]|tara:strand:- start:347 stop:1231 length:885 start_codon:yes stop_codon:yes gene_type:complete